MNKKKIIGVIGGSSAEKKYLEYAYRVGKLIAENEDADLELVIATCLLHDIAWFDTTAEKSREHGRLGAEIAKPFLEKMGFSPEQVTPICNAIAEHVVEGKPETMIAKIICDADDVDRFGPYRVLQWCFSDINDYEKLAAKLRDRIHRLEHYREKNPLFTSTKLIFPLFVIGPILVKLSI